MYKFLEGREKAFCAFDSKIFLIKFERVDFLNFDHSELKILTLKQTLQILPPALAQVKAFNYSKSLLNEIRKIVCSLYLYYLKRNH